MSCEHATTTTLLWLYGEAAESHAEHVAYCEVCQAVAADHADVMSAMAEVSHLDLRPSARADETPREATTAGPANRAGYWPLVAGLAVAAALALAVRAPAPPVEVATSEVTPVDVGIFAALEDDPLDERFDALSYELRDLAEHVEEGTL